MDEARWIWKSEVVTNQHAGKVAERMAEARRLQAHTTMILIFEVVYLRRTIATLVSLQVHLALADKRFKYQNGGWEEDAVRAVATTVTMVANST